MSIQFNSKKGTTVVDCYRSLNLLAHAQLEELEMGSSCGGHGHCGGDKVRVLKGAEHLSPLTEPEKEHLTASEIEQGYRLACQCWPDSDHTSLELAVGRVK